MTHYEVESFFYLYVGNYLFNQRIFKPMILYFFNIYTTKINKYANIYILL